MNIKKFLITACLMLQFSTAMYTSSQPTSASQTAYNAAFQVFDPNGATDTISQSANYIYNHRNSLPVGKVTEPGTALYYAAQAGNTPQALAVAEYMTKKGTSSYAHDFVGADVTKQGTTTLLTNLITALSAAQNEAAMQAAAQSTQPVIPVIPVTPVQEVTPVVPVAPVTPVTPTGPAALPQLSDTTQANWNAAFAAFGGVALIQAQTAPSTMPNSITSTSAAYGDAQVIAQYLSSTPMNATDSTNLQAALTAAAQASQPAPGSNPGTYAPQTFSPAPQFAGTGLVGNYFSSSQTATIHDPTGQNTTSYTFSNVVPQQLGVMYAQGVVQIGSFTQSGPCSQDGKVCSNVVSVINLMGQLTSQTPSGTAQNNGPAAQSSTISETFYNSVGQDITVQAVVNGTPSSQPSATVLIKYNNITPPTSGIVSVNALPNDVITYNITCPNYTTLTNFTADLITYPVGYVITPNNSNGSSTFTLTGLMTPYTVSTTFYNNTNQDISVQAFAPGLPSGTPVTIHSTDVVGTVSIAALPSQISYVVSSNNYPNYPNTANATANTLTYNPTAYPYGYQVTATQSPAALSVVGLTAAYVPPVKAPAKSDLISINFYNNTGNTISVQPLVNGNNSGGAISIDYKYTDAQPYNFKPVSVFTSTDNAIKYQISGSGATPIIINYDPTNTNGYQIDSSVVNKTTTLTATALLAPYVITTFITPFYNASNYAFTIQAFVNGQPRQDSVTHQDSQKINWQDSYPFQTGTVNTKGYTTDNVTYKISHGYFATTVPYVVNNPHGYEIDITGPTNAVIITPKLLTAAYVPKTYAMTFYNNSSQPIHVQAVVNGRYRDTNANKDSVKDIAFDQTAAPYKSDIVSINGISTDSVTYDITIPKMGFPVLNVPFDPTNTFGYQINADSKNKVIVAGTLTAAYNTQTYSTTFYNNCGTDMLIQPCVHGDSSGSSTRIKYGDNTAVKVTGFVDDSVTYKIFMPGYHNLNNDGLEVPCSTSTTNPMGYQVGVTIHDDKTMSINPIGLDKDTKFYSKLFSNHLNPSPKGQDHQYAEVYAVIDGVEGARTKIENQNNAIITVTALANQTVTYRVAIYGIRNLNKDPIEITDLTPAGYQIDIQGHDIISNPINEPSKTYSKKFYNNLNPSPKGNNTQPQYAEVYAVLTSPDSIAIECAHTKIKNQNNATITVTALANQTVTYRVVIYGIHDLNKDPIEITDLTPDEYQIDIQGHDIVWTPHTTSPAATSYNSRSLGRMSSKKTVKKDKHSRSGYNRHKRK